MSAIDILRVTNEKDALSINRALERVDRASHLLHELGLSNTSGNSGSGLSDLPRV